MTSTSIEKYRRVVEWARDRLDEAPGQRLD